MEPVDLSGFGIKIVDGSVFRGENSAEFLRSCLKETGGNRVKAIDRYMRTEADLRSTKDDAQRATDALNVIPVCGSVAQKGLDEADILEGRDLAMMREAFHEQSASDPERMRKLAGIYLQLRGMLFFPGQPVMNVDDVLR